MNARIWMALALLAVSTNIAATCYELHNADGSIKKNSPEPFFAEGSQSIAKRLSASKQEYVTSREGACTPISAPTPSSEPQYVSQATIKAMPPQCLGNDGLYHFKGDSRCAEAKKPLLTETSKPDLWGNVFDQARSRCSARHESFSLQHGCMMNEERGFKALQGDFGMPSNLAEMAKTRCKERHQSFSLQYGCMMNESRGYQSVHMR